MWLPSFNKPTEYAGSTVANNQLRMSKDSSTIQQKNSNQSEFKGLDFNDTSSSVATFLDDGRTNATSTTLLSSNNKYEQSSANKSNNNNNQYGKVSNSQFSKSPIYHDDKPLKTDPR